MMILKTIVADRDGWTLYHSEQHPLPRYHPSPRKPMAERVLAYPRQPHYPITHPVAARVTRKTDRVLAALLGVVIILLVMVAW